MTLERGWWGTDLGKHRACDDTYRLFPYESVPPPPSLDGAFAFLAPTANPPAPVALAGVTLPSPFARFMADFGLQGQIMSCTACEWDLGEAARPSRVREAAYTVRFLRDQQDCLFWYLLVGGERDGGVLCSPIPFDDPELEVDEATVYAHSRLVAPTFEEFVWRFWMENELWERLNNGDPDALDDAQRRYVEGLAK